ncbi:hypothetical protein QCA50_003823 [Cerrena zonata]|uniref:Uncharacterized protein n=1 Tax=Cerrena zonata TaxID=2478898 RepID=A0AAW0GRL6_9APHY
MRFSISEIGSKFISSIVDYYTRPPAPLENDASTSLKFRPARVITKARFKSDMEIGDKKLEEGMQLLVSNEYLVSKKEMDVLLLSRDKIQKRKAAIMEACNAKFISPKVHLSPFIYNSRASQWYRQVEKLVDRQEIHTLPHDNVEMPDGQNQNAVIASAPQPSSHDSQRSAAWSLLSSLSQRYATFASVSSGSRRMTTNNALGFESLVTHPFEGHGFWAPEVPVIVEPDNTEDFTEWLDDSLNQIDESEAGLKVFLREICMQEDTIDETSMQNIENIIMYTSTLDPMQFTHELTRRRNELHLSRASSPTEFAPSGASSATLPSGDLIEDKNPDKNTASVLLEPFIRLRVRSEATSSELVSLAETKGSRARSMTI